MPLFNLSSPPYSIAQGETTSGAERLVANEQLGTNNFSAAVAIADKGTGSVRPVVVTFSYASTPAAVQYDIYIAWDYLTPPGTWTKIGSTNNVNGDQVTIQRAAAGGPHFRFVCVKEVISPGVNAIVKVNQ
jgi:hypothetical protein